MNLTGRKKGRKNRGSFSEYRNAFFEAFAEIYEELGNMANMYEKELQSIFEMKIEVRRNHNMRIDHVMVRQMKRFRGELMMLSSVLTKTNVSICSAKSL